MITRSKRIKNFLILVIIQKIFLLLYVSTIKVIVIVIIFPVIIFIIITLNRFAVVCVDLWGTFVTHIRRRLATS